MRTAFLVLLFVALAEAQPGSIAGTVVDQSSSRPLAGVHVRLYIGGIPQMSKEAYGAMTDADGRFSVATMAPGTYTVELERAGFIAIPTNHFLYNIEILVHRGEHITGRQLAMLPLILMSGRVVNQYGDPVPAISVRISEDGASPRRVIGPPHRGDAADFNFGSGGCRR